MNETGEEKGGKEIKIHLWLDYDVRSRKIKAACGRKLFMKHVIKGAYKITSHWEKVTCERCKKSPKYKKLSNG